MDDIAQRLDDLLRTTAVVPSPAPALGPVEVEKADAARGEWHARRERERLFGSKPFSGAAWDILLDLFIAHGEGRDVTVTSLAKAAVMAESAMLRCVAMLIEGELIVRESPRADARSVVLMLSDQALGLMCDYFSRTERGSGGAGA